MPHFPEKPLPECLEALSQDQKWLVNVQLENDESSDDEEFIAYLIKEGKLSDEQARAVICFREQALSDPFFELFDTPTFGNRP